MGPKVGWAGVSGNHQGGANRSMGSRIWCPPACSVGLGMLSRGTTAPASTSVWEKAAPSALTLLSDSSVPPHLSPVPFKLLPQRWSSEGVTRPRGSPVQGPLRGTAWDSRSPPSQPKSLLVSTARVTGTRLSSTRTLGRGPGVGLGPLPPQGGLHSRDTPPDFHPPHVGVGPS